MICSHAKELMAAEWQGELHSAEQSGLRQHLETCPECSAEMAALGGLWTRLADLPAPEPSQALDVRWQSTPETLATANQPVLRTWSPADWWPGKTLWQVAVALTCLLIGILAGANLPRRNNEIAKLRRRDRRHPRDGGAFAAAATIRHRAASGGGLHRTPQDHGAGSGCGANPSCSARSQRQRKACGARCSRQYRPKQISAQSRRSAIAHAIAAPAGFTDGSGRAHRLSPSVDVRDRASGRSEPSGSLPHSRT